MSLIYGVIKANAMEIARTDTTKGIAYIGARRIIGLKFLKYRITSKKYIARILEAREKTCTIVSATTNIVLEVLYLLSIFSRVINERQAVPKALFIKDHKGSPAARLVIIVCGDCLSNMLNI
ncbi:MAG UNVERIFIED_CONTAM: hypothetical protein LVQ98_05730 [Rickettsiaceae bacterium]|jgi:hypothetical protein